MEIVPIQRSNWPVLFACFFFLNSGDVLAQQSNVSQVKKVAIFNNIVASFNRTYLLKITDTNTAFDIIKAYDRNILKASIVYVHESLHDYDLYKSQHRQDGYMVYHITRDSFLRLKIVMPFFYSDIFLSTLDSSLKKDIDTRIYILDKAKVSNKSGMYGLLEELNAYSQDVQNLNRYLLSDNIDDNQSLYSISAIFKDLKYKFEKFQIYIYYYLTFASRYDLLWLDETKRNDDVYIAYRAISVAYSRGLHDLSNTLTKLSPNDEYGKELAKVIQRPTHIDIVVDSLFTLINPVEKNLKFLRTR